MNALTPSVVYPALFQVAGDACQRLPGGRQTCELGPALSILDIYGFECFVENSFEQAVHQLCERAPAAAVQPVRAWASSLWCMSPVCARGAPTCPRQGSYVMFCTPAWSARLDGQHQFVTELCLC